MALEEIRNLLKLKEEDVSAQGLKDEDGVTSQIISIKKIISEEDINAINKRFCQKGVGLKIIRVEGYSRDPLLPRILHGNRFDLIIRNMDEQSAHLFYNQCKEQRFVTFINYYDSQRFGVAGGPYNPHLIGKYIVDGNWVGAFNEFEKSKNKENVDIAKIDEENCKNFFRRINFLKVNFFLSSYNSFLWNKEVNNYLQENKNTYMYNFPVIGNLSLFKSNKIEALNVFDVLGYKIKKDTFQIEEHMISRNLLNTTSVFSNFPQKDEINKGKSKLKVSFFLSTGSYATMLIKQLFLRLNNKYER